jgi:hypothetical protein
MEHGHREFPGRSEIASGLEVISRVAASLEETNLAGMVFFHSGSQYDEFQRVRDRYADYRGRSVEIVRPTEHDWILFPSLYEAQIIARACHVGDSGTLMRFGYEAPSPYVALWDKYPLRAHPRNATAVIDEEGPREE